MASSWLRQLELAHHGDYGSRSLRFTGTPSSDFKPSCPLISLSNCSRCHHPKKKNVERYAQQSVVIKLRDAVPGLAYLPSESRKLPSVKSAIIETLLFPPELLSRYLRRQPPFLFKFFWFFCALRRAQSFRLPSQVWSFIPPLRLSARRL